MCGTFYMCGCGFIHNVLFISQLLIRYVFSLNVEFENRYNSVCMLKLKVYIIYTS